MLVRLDNCVNNGNTSMTRNNGNCFINDVYKITHDFGQTSSLVDFFKQMNNNPKFRKDTPYMYSSQNYKICAGSSENLQASIENLTLVNKYGLLSAPKLVTMAYNRNGKYALLVYNIPYAKPYNSSHKPNKNSKMQYLSELVDFSKKSRLYNPADSNPDNWLISADGKIILADWSELKEFTDYISLKEHYESLAKELNL